MGGHVFGTTTPIKKENIDPTLQKFIVKLGHIFPEKKHTFKSFGKLGSVGKKDISGDIDLSYDIQNILPEGKPDFKGWGIDRNKFNALVFEFTKRARTATSEKIQLRAMIELIGEKIDKFLKDIDTKSSGGGSIFCNIPQYNTLGEKIGVNVQIDINIGNPEWLRFSYYSNTYSGNVKGLHRTQLMLALFSEKGYTFGHTTGVINKKTHKQEANTPKEAIRLLNRVYKFNLTQDILDDYFKLEDFLRNNLSSDEYNNIIDRYLKILDSTRTDIPDNLQKYWLGNKKRLDLKGKFLPEDSKLFKYKTV